MTHNPDGLVRELISKIPEVPNALEIIGQVVKELENQPTRFDCNIYKVGHETRVGFFLVEDTDVRELLERTRAYIRFTVENRNSDGNIATMAYITNRVFAESGLFLNGSEVYKTIEIPLEYGSDINMELGDAYQELFLETIKSRM